MKITKKGWIIFCIFSLLFISGCDAQWGYGGEHQDLCATAVHSIPGAYSGDSDGFLILEQDEYGRTLFAASFNGSMLSDEVWAPSVYAVMVMQKSDDDFAYFYSGKNYIFQFSSDFMRMTEETCRERFSAEEIDQLKEANDWGKPPEENRDVCIKVSTNSDARVSLPYSSRRMLYTEIGHNIRTEYFREDASGKKIFFVLNIEQDEKITYYSWHAAMFDSDWKLVEGPDAVISLTSMETIHADLASFMEKNDWEDITE